jgi:peptidoglycan/LPS O-acetylase OafA/YrhL
LTVAVTIPVAWLSYRLVERSGIAMSRAIVRRLRESSAPFASGAVLDGAAVARRTSA